jgi:hypothetical protein
MELENAASPSLPSFSEIRTLVAAEFTGKTRRSFGRDAMSKVGICMT